VGPKRLDLAADVGENLAGVDVLDPQPENLVSALPHKPAEEALTSTTTPSASAKTTPSSIPEIMEESLAVSCWSASSARLRSVRSTKLSRMWTPVQGHVGDGLEYGESCAIGGEQDPLCGVYLLA